MASPSSRPSLQKLPQPPLPPPPPSPPPPPPVASLSGSGGEYLLHLLQQGRSSDHPSDADGNSRSNHSSYSDDANNSRHHSSSSSGTFSRASSMEAAAIEEEQVRCHLQQDPAVAAMGPSHRVAEVNTMSNSSINGNNNDRGLLALQEHHHLQQHHHHHHHHQLRLSVSPSPLFDVPFPAPIRPPFSDHFLPSPLDPLFRPAPNQFFRPYPYAQFPVVDHNPYVRVPPAFTHTGLLNPNRLQDMACSFAHAGSENPKQFSHTGIPNPQDMDRPNALLPAHRMAADIESSSGNGKALGVQKSQIFTQFGSIGVEIAPQPSGKECVSLTSNPSLFEQSFLPGESPGVLSPTPSSKGNLAKGHGPIGPMKREEEHFSHDLKASLGPAVSVVSSIHQQRALQPVHMKNSDVTGSSPSLVMDRVVQLSKESASPIYGIANAPLGASNLSAHQQKPVFDTSLLNARESLVKVFDCEGTHRADPQIKSRPKGPQKVQDGSRKGVIKNGSGHWVAVMKDKNDEDVVTGMELAGIPEELSSKTSEDVRKRRGQSQEWRLKQLNAASHTQWQSPDSGTIKSKDSVKKNSRIRNKLLLQDGPVGLPSGTKVDSAPSSATEQSKQALHTTSSIDKAESVMGESDFKLTKTDGGCKDSADEENEEAILGCVGFLELEKDNEAEEEEIGIRHEFTGSLIPKDPNSDVKQPVNRFARLTKFNRREVLNRPDMGKCTSEFLSIFQKLIPPVDEELRRKQLLSILDELVSGIWPEARLYLFGSCANAFGVCNSDIDVCLSIDGESSSRSELVRTLADVLKENHMQNVQALTHARVPIVKYSDPTTGISCDVCVNNMLAVVNTKLLHDYAQIDVRLRQLAFMVKHWAKCRQVNETYRGTLSSYAYVLMCIHFLQQRKPPVLPCLQEMEPTYRVTVGDIKCAYFDRVDRLKGFGQKNKETLADLVTLFFEYWAFRHDYSHTVISIRTGNFLSKVEKDWTRRIGNERHLICIEDPFEVSHDLGRVVDKHSIRVLRDEFQRAARIMRHDANPCVALFEPYVRQKAQAA